MLYQTDIISVVVLYSLNVFFFSLGFATAAGRGVKSVKTRNQGVVAECTACSRW